MGTDFASHFSRQTRWSSSGGGHAGSDQCSAVQQIDLPLPAQIPKNLADLLSAFPKEHPLAIHWYYHNMRLAVPLHMRLTLPILHGDPPWPLWRIVFYCRGKWQSLMNSHRQSRWITSDLADLPRDTELPGVGRYSRCRPLHTSSGILMWMLQQGSDWFDVNPTEFVFLTEQNGETRYRGTT